MKTKAYEITYILDRTLVEYTKVVNAEDFTKAYLSVYLKLPEGGMITDVTEINN